jgi:hypothetical protein
VLVLAGAVLLAATGVAYSTPTTVTEQTDERTFTLGLATSAVVTGETPLFAPGTVVEEAPVYLFDATPAATLVTTTEVTGGEAAVTHDVTLVVRAVDGDRVFWSERRSLASETGRTTDGRFVTRTDLDVATLRATRLAEVGDAVGAAGRVETAVVVESAVTAGPYADRLSVTTPLVVGGDAYEFGADRTATARHATPVARDVAPPRDEAFRTRLLGGTGLVAVGVAVGVLARRRDPVVAAARLDAARFDDWVSTGAVASVPADAVVVRDLGDLVDVAVDTGRRVVYDPERGLYVVLDDAAVYVTPGVDPAAVPLGPDPADDTDPVP